MKESAKIEQWIQFANQRKHYCRQSKWRTQALLCQAKEKLAEALRIEAVSEMLEHRNKHYA